MLPIVVAALTTCLSPSAQAANTPSGCERFTLHELAPGMSYDRVRRTMGGEGMRTLTRTPDSHETTVAYYRNRDSLSEVYVEYNHRVDRRPQARTVLIRAQMPLEPTSVEGLVARYGVPDDGAAQLAGGLHNGVAVWVNEPCGMVLTAYRPRAASWWAAEGGTTLQLETLELALKGGSPGSARVSTILARKHGAPPTSPAEASGIRIITTPTTESDAETETEETETDPVADSLETPQTTDADADAAAAASDPLAMETDELPSPATDPVMELAASSNNTSRDETPASATDAPAVPQMPPPEPRTVIPVTVTKTQAPASQPAVPVTPPPLESDTHATSSPATDVPAVTKRQAPASQPAVPVTPPPLESDTHATSSPARNVPVTTKPASVPEPVAQQSPPAPAAKMPPPAVQQAVPPKPTAPQTIATWRLDSPAHVPTAAPNPNPPAAPKTIATWRAGSSADAAPTTAPTSTPPSTASTYATWRASVVTPEKPAERISFVPPVYPPTARWLGKNGHVTLSIVVNPDGTVARAPRVVAVHPPGLGFAQSAIEAVRKWRYKPAIQQGKPVASNITVDVAFD